MVLVTGPFFGYFLLEAGENGVNRHFRDLIQILADLGFEGLLHFFFQKIVLRTLRKTQNIFRDRTFSRLIAAAVDAGIFGFARIISMTFTHWNLIGFGLRGFRLLSTKLAVVF